MHIVIIIFLLKISGGQHLQILLVLLKEKNIKSILVFINITIGVFPY